MTSTPRASWGLIAPMTTPPAEPSEPPSPQPDEGPLTEWLLRIFAVAFLLWAVGNLGHAWWVDRTRWTMLLLLASETYTLALVVTARRAITRDLSPLAIAATLYAAFFFVLFRTDTVRLVPEAVGVATQLASLAWEVASKVTLGRSFGLLPAHRKVVLGGPYRIVRHPIYFGYVVHHVGFLLVNWHAWNLLVVATLVLAQMYRIQREELFLSQAAEYRDYQARVRWRLVPFVW